MLFCKISSFISDLTSRSIPVYRSVVRRHANFLATFCIFCKIFPIFFPGGFFLRWWFGSWWFVMFVIARARSASRCVVCHGQSLNQGASRHPGHPGHPGAHPARSNTPNHTFVPGSSCGQQKTRLFCCEGACCSRQGGGEC